MTKYTPTITSTSFAYALVSFMNKQTSSVDASSNLEILHMNDHHSYLAPKSFDLFGEDIPSALNSSTISKISINYGGMPLIKALIDSVEEDNADGSLLKLHCGDAIVGTPFFTVSHLHLAVNFIVRTIVSVALVNLAQICQYRFDQLFNGEVDAHMMAHICFDAFGIGNHGEYLYCCRFSDNFYNMHKLNDEMIILVFVSVRLLQSPIQNLITGIEF